jgi:hypothetical protein
MNALQIHPNMRALRHAWKYGCLNAWRSGRKLRKNRSRKQRNMPIIDHYFFEGIGILLMILTGMTAFICVGMKFKGFARFMFISFIIVVGSIDIVMWGSFIADKMRHDYEHHNGN